MRTARREILAECNGARVWLTQDDYWRAVDAGLPIRSLYPGGIPIRIHPHILAAREDEFRKGGAYSPMKPDPQEDQYPAIHCQRWPEHLPHAGREETSGYPDWIECLGDGFVCTRCDRRSQPRPKRQSAYWQRPSEFVASHKVCLPRAPADAQERAA